MFVSHLSNKAEKAVCLKRLYGDSVTSALSVSLLQKPAPSSSTPLHIHLALICPGVSVLLYRWSSLSKHMVLV